MTGEKNSIAKTYDLLKWILPVISKYPKDRKYSLGQRIENKILDVLELLIKANYSRQKVDLLKDANIELEIIRHLIRISYDLRFISVGKYEYFSREINEIGRMVGGWIKSLNRIETMRQSVK